MRSRWLLVDPRHSLASRAENERRQCARRALAALIILRLRADADASDNPPEGTPSGNPEHRDTARSEDNKNISDHGEIHDSGEHFENPNVRYEERQVPVGWVLAIAIITCVIGALIFVGVHYFLKSQENVLAQRRKSPFPLVEHPSDQLPPEPRLEQVDRLAHVETPNVFLSQSADEQVLHSYGQTSENGFVHIPIEKAMQLTTGQLPIRKQPPNPTLSVKDDGLIDAGDPNSGRLFQKGPQ